MHTCLLLKKSRFCLLASLLLSLLLQAPPLHTAEIKTASACGVKMKEPDHGAFSFTFDDLLPNDVGWYDKSTTTMPAVGAVAWGAGWGFWAEPWDIYWDGDPGSIALPECNTILQVIVNPENDQQYRIRIRRDIYEMPSYLTPPPEGFTAEEFRVLLAKWQNSYYGNPNGYSQPDTSIIAKAGDTILSSPGMSNPTDGGGGCSTCGNPSQNGTKFKVSIGLGSQAAAVSPTGIITFNGDLVNGDLLKLENFTVQSGVGSVTGSIGSGSVTAYMLDSTTPTASAAITTTSTGGLLDSVQIVVTPLPTSSGVATTHLFTRVTASGGMSGVRYTRTEAGASESVDFYNTGTDAPQGPVASGVFKLVNIDGSSETWTSPPEVTSGTPTFVWTADTSHDNGGYFAGTAVETHEYLPAASGAPKTVTVRTYGRIGTVSRNLRVLLSEEVSKVAVTTTLSTEVTRYGYDEKPWLFMSSYNILGTTNQQFGKRLWTLSSDGSWRLEMAQEVPFLHNYYERDPVTGSWTTVSVPEFYYGDPLEYSPWLDGPGLPASLLTQADAAAFFAGLMTEARGNGWKIAGCRTSVPEPRPSNAYVAWTSKSHVYLGTVKQGVEYSYNNAWSYVYLPAGQGTFGLAVPDEDSWLSLTQRAERWNAGETAGTWSSSGPADYNGGTSVSLDQAGVARLSYSGSVTGGGTTANKWQVSVTADGDYDTSRTPPSYTASSAHPLWSTIISDADGRTVSESSKFSESGTTIQTITTTYAGESGYTRSAGGVTLSSQGDDVVAGGLRTSTSTDILGITTTTVTNDATGELVSETRLGLTTNYARTTGTDGSTTQTVTQTADGTTRTLSVTVTDAQGRTVSSTDANGGVTTYSYANHGRTVTETLPGGGTRITENYLDGQLKSITGTAVTPEYHSYTVNDGSVGTYEAGSVTETVYYGADSGAAWRKTTTNYLGQVLREEAPSPTGTGVSARVHTYNAKGQRVKTSSSGMADLIIAYDGWGRVSQQGYDMDADGELTVSSTDVLSTSSTDYVTGEGTVLEQVVHQQYTQDGDDTTLQTKTERKLLEGSSWQRSTQADGGVFTQFDVLSGSTRTVHGQQSVTGTQSQIQIYQNGLLMSETPPGMTSAVTYTYNGFGQVATVVHPLNGTTTRTYDTAGRVLTQGQTGGDTVTYAYNSQGQVTSETHSDSSTTTYTYDGQGRVLTQGGTAGYPLGYEYDAMGRLWKLHTYRGGGADDVTTWTYAASGVLLSKTDAAATPQSMSYTYDAAGRVLTRTWARGVTTTYSYDAMGRQTGIDYSDSTPDVSLTYDRAGRRTGTTDAAGTHAYAYDDAASGGRVSGWSVSGTGAWSGLSVGYGNTAGKRSSRTTSLGSLTLPTVNYTYDAGSGRMSGVSASDFSVSYSYDAATGWNGGVTYTSGLSSTRTADALGRLDAITWSVGGVTVSGHDYTLNALNRRTAAQRQDGSSWSYGYNARGEVTSAAKGTEPGKQFAFAYDDIGNRTSSSVSSIASTTTLRTTGYSANALNQYDSITHPQPGWLVLRGSANTAAGTTVTIDGNAPTLTAGTLWFYEQSVDNTEGSVRREVEITATRPDGGVNNGPITTQQQGALFIPPPTEVPTYDLDGNPTSDARWNYVWNGENRLIAQEEKSGFTVQPTSSAPVKRIRLEFDYDAQGRRIAKRTFIATGSGGFVLQQSLVELYDGWNMIAEIDATTSATPLRSYEWGPDVSGTMTGAGGVGGLLIERCYTVSTTGTYAPCYDGNGNVTELVNVADGNVSARYEYGAFGETISMDGNTLVAANPFCFSTKYLDAETGFYNFGYRYYDAVTGRWLARDPLEERGGKNLYAMAGNDAVNKFDYLGLNELTFEKCTVKLGLAHEYGAAEALTKWNNSWNAATGILGSWDSSKDSNEPYARASAMGCNYFGGNGPRGIAGYKGATETNGKDAERAMLDMIFLPDERTLGVIHPLNSMGEPTPAWNGGFNPGSVISIKPIFILPFSIEVIDWFDWDQENQAAGYLRFISYNWQQALKTGSALATQCEKSKNCCCPSITVTFNILHTDARTLFEWASNHPLGKWSSFVTRRNISAQFTNLQNGQSAHELPTAGQDSVKFKIRTRKK